MKSKTALMIASLTLVATGATAQLPDGEVGALPVDRENPLAVWLDSIQPGGAHRALAERAGTWTVVYRSWFRPDQAPTDVTGIAERSMILNGVVLEEKLTLPLPGRQYSGVTYLGYNNVTEEYWWQRLDNMSTWVTQSSGSTRSEDGVVTFEVPVLNHVDGSDEMARVVLKTEPDREIFEWYQPDENGEIFKAIEYEYTRYTANEESDEGSEAEGEAGATEIEPGAGTGEAG